MYHKMRYGNVENVPEFPSNLALSPDGRLLISLYWRRAVIYAMQLAGCENNAQSASLICETEIVAGNQFERGYFHRWKFSNVISLFKL